MQRTVSNAIATLASIRFAFKRKVEVLYTAPGFLQGTYMYTGHSATQADLVAHAIRMKYGQDTAPMLDDDLCGIVVVVKEVRV